MEKKVHTQSDNTIENAENNPGGDILAVTQVDFGQKFANRDQEISTAPVLRVEGVVVEQMVNQKGELKVGVVFFSYFRFHGWWAL